MWVAAKAAHMFFSKNIIVYAIFNDQSFNDTLTNDIVSFEQLGPGYQHVTWMLRLAISVWFITNDCKHKL